MNPAIELLADRLVATRFRQEPLEAALLGLTDGAGELADLSAETQRELRDSFASVGASAEALATSLNEAAGDRDEVDVLTLDLIRLSATAAAAAMTVPLDEFTVTDLYVTPLSGILAVLPMLPLDTDDRRRDQLARLAAVPRFLDQSAQRLRDGAGAARHAPDVPQSPPGLLGDAGRGTVAQHLIALAERPLQPIERAEALGEHAPELQEVGDVVDGIGDLVGRDRPLQPVREAVCLGERNAEHPLDEP